MRTMLFIALLFASTAAVAQAPAPAEGPEGKPRQEMSFEDKKAHILKKMTERRACVEAAKDKEALQACMPKRHAWKGKHKGEGAPAKAAEEAPKSAE